MELFADASAEDLNLRYHQTGRGLVFGLDGLQTHGDLPITNEWERFCRNAELLALTRLNRDRFELARVRRIGSPLLYYKQGSATTIGERHTHGLVFTFDHETKNQATKGWEALRDALAKQYDDQIKRHQEAP